jgi:hypothetical protein
MMLLCPNLHFLRHQELRRNFILRSANQRENRLTPEVNMRKGKCERRWLGKESTWLGNGRRVNAKIGGLEMISGQNSTEKEGKERGFPRRFLPGHERQLHVAHVVKHEQNKSRPLYLVCSLSLLSIFFMARLHPCSLLWIQMHRRSAVTLWVRHGVQADLTDLMATTSRIRDWF